MKKHTWNNNQTKETKGKRSSVDLKLVKCNIYVLQTGLRMKSNTRLPGKSVNSHAKQHTSRSPLLHISCWASRPS